MVITVVMAIVLVLVRSQEKMDHTLSSCCEVVRSLSLLIPINDVGDDSDDNGGGRRRWWTLIIL